MFTELTHSGVLPWIWIPVAHLNRVIAEGRPAHFAECQVCHEAWVWKRETEIWVELGKLEQKHNARP